ncbi:MAG: hypothetical protein IE933_01675 [Sphingomonadales bacterium]|nr:hypothetical protein [Sphingomonadales bacterium]MBD3775022.1 hypothetical protein [Paracoccaceae bacterium]
MADPFEQQADHTGAIEQPDHGLGEHLEPNAFGLGPGAWVSLSMLVLLAIAFGYAKAHKAITGGLDNKIAAIKQQLDEAKNLRAEAEALRDEYAAKIANAEKDAEAMIAHAQGEADHILEKAEADSTAMIERRKKMAEDKIAAAERSAVEEVRAVAVSTAATAAKGLIAEKHDAAADAKLADELISGI